jgi:hypothetical protein
VTGPVGPKPFTQVRSGWVVCLRRVHENRLVGVIRVRDMSDLCIYD